MAEAVPAFNWTLFDNGDLDGVGLGPFSRGDDWNCWNDCHQEASVRPLVTGAMSCAYAPVQCACWAPAAHTPTLELPRYYRIAARGVCASGGALA